MNNTLVASVTCRTMNRPTFTVQNVRLDFNPENIYRYIVEASLLGLRPGQWPTTITVTLENGQSHFLVPGRDERTADNELISRTYVALDGFGPNALVILND